MNGSKHCITSKNKTTLYLEKKKKNTIDKIHNKSHGLSPPGGLVSPSGGFASLAFDQAVPKNSQRHLADRNSIRLLQ